jgi:hypothetical protein
VKGSEAKRLDLHQENQEIPGCAIWRPKLATRINSHFSDARVTGGFARDASFEKADAGESAVVGRVLIWGFIESEKFWYVGISVSR